jgi:hypothetical protein
MENENKNTVLSDDQLKDVTGGALFNNVLSDCTYKTQTVCRKSPECVWKNNQCVSRG